MYRSPNQVNTDIIAEGISVLKKILGSCAGYCIAKKHIVFSKVNKCNFFQLNSVKYFTYFICTNQAEKLASNSQWVLSEDTDDHTWSHVFDHIVWRKGTLEQFRTVYTKWKTDGFFQSLRFEVHLLFPRNENKYAMNRFAS